MSQQQVPKRFKYKAFISYSHEADSKTATAIQSGLHNFARPFYLPRAIRVFRDSAELSANPSLWGSVQKALDDSEYLILLAAPKSAGSRWVRREVDYWLGTHNGSVDNLLIVLTEGQLEWEVGAGDFSWSLTTALPRRLDWNPNNASPRTLEGVFTEEPLYMDLRDIKTLPELSLRTPLFADAIATLASTLHGKPKSDLIGEDIKQHTKYRRARTGALVAVSVLALTAGVAAVYANGQKNEANHQRVTALEAVDKRDQALGREKVALENEKSALSLREAAFLERDKAVSDREQAVKDKELETAAKVKAVHEREVALNNEKRAWEQARQQELTAIRNRLDAELLDDASRAHTPIEVERWSYLSGLLPRAELSGHQDAKKEIEQRLACLANPQNRSELLPADASRLSAAVNAAGTKLGIAYKDRLDILDARTHKVLATKPLSAEGERVPAQRVWMRADDYGDYLIYEVEYEKPSADEERKQPNQFFVSTFDATASTLLSLDAKTVRDLKRNVSSKRVQLRHVSVLGNRSQKTDSIPDYRGQSERLKDKLKLDERSAIIPLAYDSSHNAGIYAIITLDRIPTAETPAPQQAPAEYYRIFFDEERIVRLGETVRRTSLVITQPTLKVGPRWESTPAAMDFERRVVLLDNGLIKISEDGSLQTLPMNLVLGSGIGDMQFTGDQGKIALYFKDGSMALSSANPHDASKETHRFLRVKDARALALSPKNQQVILVDKRGAVYGWNISAFTSNGWADDQCSEGDIDLPIDEEEEASLLQSWPFASHFRPLQTVLHFDFDELLTFRGISNATRKQGSLR